MFGDATRELSSWLTDACSDVEVVLAPPTGDSREGARLHAFLLEISELNQRSDRRLDDRSGPSRRYETTRATLRYVLAVEGDLPAADAHDVLACAVGAAAGRPDVTIAPEPVPLDLWRAYGVPPRPALLLDVRVTSERQVADDLGVVRAVEVDAHADHGTQDARAGPQPVGERVVRRVRDAPPSNSKPSASRTSSTGG